MPSIYAKSVGRRDLATSPIVRKDLWLWRYGPQVQASQWIDEGMDTPGYPALSTGTPTPLVGLPGASWDAAEFFADTNAERNTPHLALFAWIKPTLIAGNDRFILGKYDSVGPLGFRWYIRHTVSQMYAVFQTAGGTAVFTENATSIVVDEWQQVGLVWNPDTNYATFLRNGVVTRTATGVGGTGVIQASEVGMNIGVNSTGSNPFAGDIALPGGLNKSILPHINEYARFMFEQERRIFGV